MRRWLTSSEERGFSFGLTSGIITTLGLIIGLYSSTESVIVVLAGILSIAIADSFSDAMGIHVSEEAKKGSTSRSIWRATIYTFLAKLFFALSFMIPIIIFELGLALIICITYGLILIAVYSYYISVRHGKKPYAAIIEHVLIVLIVIAITYFVGNLLKGLQS